MAVIIPTFTPIYGPNGGIDALMIQWGPIGDTDACTPVQRPDLADKSVQFEGTFAGATVVFQGSNNSTTGLDGNFETLNDPTGVALSAAAAKIKQVGEATLWIMPATSGGSGSAVTVTVMARRSLR
jgi:hypothetical protein